MANIFGTLFGEANRTNHRHIQYIVMENQHLCPGCFSEKGDVSVCPTCGYDESQERSPILLAHRTVLNEQYLIGKVLGKPGGFGITYLAWDMYLQTYVAIKEFLPRDLAGRANDRATVQPHTNDDSKLFSYGLEQFINEARTLAQFDHPNVVRVKTFFKSFGTAYMVMDYYDGMSLNEYMSSKGNVLGETITLGIMYPILDGLHEVHNKGFLHRDIKPHNIFLTSSKRVILLDFGAARVSMNERSKSMSVVLTPGFAPPEQYHGKGKQGPWTDIYAVAATMYYMMTGSVPAEATERLYEDQLPTVKDMKPEISQAVSDALHRAMAIRAEDRPQSIPEFQAMLAGMPIESVPASAAPKSKVPVAEPEFAPTIKQQPKSTTKSGGAGKWIGIAAGVLIVASGGWYFMQLTEPVPEPAADVIVDTPYRTLIEQGQNEFASGDYDAAMVSWRAAGALRPDSVSHLSRMGAAQDSITVRNQRLEEARKIAEAVNRRIEEPRPTVREPVRPAVIPYSYVNDFNAASTVFPTENQSDRKSSYSGGLYQIQVTNDRLHRINPGFQIDLTADITLTTRVRHNVAPSTPKQTGLMFGELDGKYHVFTVRTDGTLYIGQYTGTAWVALDNFISNSAIRRGALYNVLKIEKRGTTYTFFINDSQVARHTIASLHGNRFGILVEGPATVDYDYFYLNGTQI